MSSYDLICLVPGNDEEQTLRGLLDFRTQSLKIKHVRYEILKHPGRDPGCLLRGPEILQPYQSLSKHALIILDHEGCGKEDKTVEEIETDLDSRLSRSGWADRAKAFVLDPELEIWIWSDSPEVDRVLGWNGRVPQLREWLHRNGWWEENAVKPSRPKEALEAAIRESRTRRSSSLYKDLAMNVGLGRCADRSFARFKGILRTWFHRVRP